jgi:tRNA 2-thiouridine synthesizing protein A
MNCPLPILKTKKAIDTLESGQVLRMTATDPGSIPDVAAFSNRTGHAILEQSEGGGEYSFLIRKR